MGAPTPVYYLRFIQIVSKGRTEENGPPIRGGGRAIRPLKILEPTSPPSLGDKIYNERFLTDPVFPLPQSERRQLALKMKSMVIYIYIYIYI